MMGLGVLTYGLISTAAQIAMLLLIKHNFISADILITILPYVKLLIIVIPMYLIGLPLCLIVFNNVKGDRPPKYRTGFGQLLSWFMICFPIGFILNLISSFLARILTRGRAQNALEDLVSNPNIFMVLTVAMAGPVVEEFIFRKVIIDRTRRYGEWTAVLFSSLCFALFHMNLFQVLYAFALGLIFGMVYVRTGKIWITMFMHMIFNFWGAVVPTLVMSGINSEILEAIGQNPGAISEILKGVTSSEKRALVIMVLYIIAQIVFFFAGIVCLVLNMAGHKFRLNRAIEELPRGVCA
jgi:membrane protease YdiL (CAAX protease family)